MSGWRYTDDTPERDDAAEESVRAARSNGGSVEHRGAPDAPARRDLDAVRELGSVVAGRYVLKRHLGRGRYGEIYEAVDRSLSDPQIQQEHCVALHLLHDRITQQARLLQKLEASYHQPHLWSHPNVVKVRGFGRDGGKYYLVMELLDGVTLRSILDDPSSEPVSENEAFAVLRAVGDALKYAHAKGSTHGDIRPEKIFITEGYAVKVLDLLPASAPRTSPFFIEEAAANGLGSPDQRDDVYGLACLAYELFAGRHPYNANSPLEALNAGLNAAPILRLGAKRWDALARGLALRREHRTASVAAFLGELGITGNEKLRPEGDAAAMAPAATSAPPVPPARKQDGDVPIVGDYSGSWEVRKQPAAPTPAPPPPPPQDAAFPASTASWQRYSRDFEMYAEPASRRERLEPRPILWGLALVAALAVVAAVGVYWNYQPARSRAAEWISQGVTLAENALSRGAEVSPRTEQQTVVTPPIATVPPDRASDVGAAPAGSGASAVPDSAGAAVPDSPGAQPTARVEPTLPPQPKQPAQTAAAISSGAAEASGPEVVEFAASVVTVSEGQAVATAVIRRRSGELGESSFVWWTSDGSALADDDYANLGARIEKFAAGEETHTIHIPIVVDSRAEGRESFYVNLREGEQLGRRLDEAQRIEVVVVDDD